VKTFIIEVLLGIISINFFTLGMSIGVVSCLLVYLPRIDFRTGAISSRVRSIRWLKVRQFVDRYLLDRQANSDFYHTRHLIGLIGATLSLAIALFPIVFYYDIRMYLFFLGVDIFIGILGLALYYFWIYLSGK
jgi:hypothetical protein